MKVKPYDAIEDRDVLWVHLDCPIGAFWAVWEGVRPELNREYHVEMEIDQVLRTGETIRTTALAAPAVRAGRRDMPVALVGQVEDVFHEQGTVLLRLGDDLLRVEVEGAVAVNSWVECRAFPLKVYDENL